MIVVDVEASGTEPHKHSIVSVGALELEKPDRQFYGECKVWGRSYYGRGAGGKWLYQRANNRRI